MYLGLCVHTYHVRNNYVLYIVAMQVYFSNSVGQMLCVASYYE